MSIGTEATITPVSPPMTKMKKKPSTNSSGVLEHRPAVPQRRQPAENLHAVRDGDHHAGGGEEARAELGQAGREHVVDPQAEREEARPRSATSTSGR